jgi:hypothetical protein
MPTPRTFALPEDVAAMIDEENAATGQSPQDIIRRHMERNRRPLREYPGAGVQHLPVQSGPPKTMSDVLREAMEQQTTLKVIETMNGGSMGPQRAPPLTAADIASAVTAALDAREPRRGHRRDEDDDDSFSEIERMLAKKAKLKMLREFSGDENGGERKFLDSQIGELNKRIDAANERAAGAERDNFKNQVDQANARSKAIEELMLERTQSLEARIEQIQSLRDTGQDPPKDALDRLTEDMGRLEKLKNLFGGGKPDTWDRVERAIDKAADLGGKMLEGVAAVEAGKRGVPPHATFTGPPGGGAHYLDDGTGAAAQGDSITLSDGQVIPIATLPENPPGGYTLTNAADGKQTKVTRAEFIAAVQAEMKARGQASVGATAATAAAPAAPPAAPPPAPEGHHHHPAPAPAPTPAAPMRRGVNPFTREAMGTSPGVGPAPPTPIPAVNVGPAPAPAAAPTPPPPPPAAPAPAAPAPEPEPEPEPTPEEPPAEPKIPDGVMMERGASGPITVDEEGHIVGSGPAPDISDSGE